MNLLFFSYPLITASLYYLGARALITQPIWSRYPPRFDSFMSCAACSGFWYGFLVGIFGLVAQVPFLGVAAWWTPFVVGLGSMIWTPIVADWHERSIMGLMGQGADTSAPQTVAAEMSPNIPCPVCNSHTYTWRNPVTGRCSECPL